MPVGSTIVPNDLDDSTRSQVYREDRTSRASAAVESTRGLAVVENGAVIVRSEYSAKKTAIPQHLELMSPCVKVVNSLAMDAECVNGALRRWATQRGQTAEWMVEHYYPNAAVGGGVVTSDAADSSPAAPRSDRRCGLPVSRCDV